MNDGMLSQDEIDALLKVGEEEDEMDKNSSDTLNSLSTIEIDTLGEIGNISFGSSATTLSTLLNQKVDITTPKVTVIKNTELNNVFDYDHVNIQVNYIEGFNGQNVLVMKSEDAAVISDIMLGGEGTSPDNELNEIHLSAVQEAMNQMMGTAATSMSTVFGKRVDISPPTINLEKSKGDESAESFPDEEHFVKVSFQLQVGNLIDSNIMQLIPVQFAKQLVDQLLNASSSDAKEEAAVTAETEKPKVKTEQKANSDQEMPESAQYLGDSIDQDNSSIQQATFSNFEQVELNKSEQRNLDMLLDIPLKVTVELGRTKRTIKDILELSAGSIIELDKLAGEPVDILVNEKLIAKGEVVVIDENFGVRVTDISSRTDRLMKLK
ncbi:flagellar motor switch protein FliN/FliY [Virgibacillus litoralis]|uniref:Flagellar motor switch protein FliN/FliY n=2 Tax=Virgibacillus litoralis TaxID=578221 RepID=A0ABS4HDY8_9BACI|nr:flagellar motor switch phosphatase FliY [Virgibacillus litoralis]MBP1949134.1 flagellar motor switch protein FliN/FliY [Virgibacillus litoralis]